MSISGTFPLAAGTVSPFVDKLTLRAEHCFLMTGMGGNRVHVFPSLELVAVITSANFGRRDAHALSDRLLEDQILARREDW